MDERIARFFTPVNRYQVALAFICALLVISLQSFYKVPNPRESDGRAYMSVALDLANTGIFTDGLFVHNPSSAVRGPHGEGMFFAPLYPIMVASVMTVDPVLHDTVSCVLGRSRPMAETDSCPTDFGLLRFVHIALAAISAFLVWAIAYAYTGQARIAWGAFVLGCMAEAYAHYTAQIMTENLLFPLFSAFLFFLVCAIKRGSALFWVLTGLVLGLCALTRPSFLYVFYFAIPLFLVFIFAFARQPHTRIAKAAMLACFIAGFVLAISPWVARNAIMHGEFAITKGYDSFILVQRLAYNKMTPQEWLASFVFGLPDFGDDLAEDLFGTAQVKRFNYTDPEGFYVQGNHKDREETLAKAGGPERHLSYLLKEELAPHWFWHILVTFSLAWRGMWVSKYWGLLTIPLAAVFMGHELRHKRWTFLMVMLPALFLLGFHAFVSVNVVRYNLILIPGLAVAAAIVLDALYTRLKQTGRRHASLSAA